MADDILEKHPSEEVLYEADFTELLPDDTTISAASAVTAIDSSGIDASGTVVGTVTQSGMLLRAIMQAGVNFEDYLVTFVGRGATTLRDRVWLLEMRVRTEHRGNL